jgi:WD40 repeat protein
VSALVRKSLRDDPHKSGQYASACWPAYAGRKHWFVEGDEYSNHGPPHPLWRLRDDVAHPLCVIAPLHAVVRGQGESADVLVVCDCGEVGTPQALGWAGDCCGPCSDRRAEGGSPAGRLAVHAHPAEVSGLTFDEEDCVLSTVRDGGLHRFDPRSGDASMRLTPGHEGGMGVAALPGDRAAVASYRWVVCWDLRTGAECWATSCPGEAAGLTASPDGDWLAVDMVDVPYLIDAWSGKRRRGPNDWSHFAFGPDGRLYAFDSGSRCVSSLDVETGDIRETGLQFGEPEEDDCFGLACSPVGGLLAAGGNGGRVRIGDAEAGRWLHEFHSPATLVSSLAFSPDGGVLATGHSGAVVFWDVQAGRQRGRLALPFGYVCCLAFAPDGQTLAVGDGHGVVRLWPWRRLLSTAVG